MISKTSPLSEALTDLIPNTTKSSSNSDPSNRIAYLLTDRASRTPSGTPNELACIIGNLGNNPDNVSSLPDQILAATLKVLIDGDYQMRLGNFFMDDCPGECAFKPELKAKDLAAYLQGETSQSTFPLSIIGEADVFFIPTPETKADEALKFPKSGLDLLIAGTAAPEIQFIANIEDYLRKYKLLTD